MSKLIDDFETAVVLVKETAKPLATDVKLKLYALYKIATRNQENPSGNKPMVSAFKANALFQARHLDSKNAMKQYIEIVEKEVR